MGKLFRKVNMIFILTALILCMSSTVDARIRTYMNDENKAIVYEVKDTVTWHCNRFTFTFSKQITEKSEVSYWLYLDRAQAPFCGMQYFAFNETAILSIDGQDYPINKIKQESEKSKYDRPEKGFAFANFDIPLDLISKIESSTNGLVLRVTYNHEKVSPQTETVNPNVYLDIKRIISLNRNDFEKVKSGK